MKAIIGTEHIDEDMTKFCFDTNSAWKQLTMCNIKLGHWWICLHHCEGTWAGPCRRYCFKIATSVDKEDNIRTIRKYLLWSMLPGQIQRVQKHPSIYSEWLLNNGIDHSRTIRSEQKVTKSVTFFSIHLLLIPVWFSNVWNFLFSNHSAPTTGRCWFKTFSMLNV